MSKNGFKKSTISNTTLAPSTINPNSSNFISNSNLNLNNQNFLNFSILDNLDDSDFFAPPKNQTRPGRIIHQTTEHSIDKKRGIRVVKTKIVREIDSINDLRKNKNKKIKIITKNRSQANYNNLNLNNSNNVININTSKNYDLKTYKSKQNKLYSSPDFSQGSPINNEIISPLGSIPYYSSESENECQIKSFDKNQKKKGKIRKMKEIKSINYELEEPNDFDYLTKNVIQNRNLSKGNLLNNKRTKLTEIILNKSEFYNHNNRFINNSYQSDLVDFQSPDRVFNNQNKFRKITENMIQSKGPTNDDKKITKSIKTKMNIDIKNKKLYKNNNLNLSNLSKIQAAKIIQKWWRNNKYREEEVLDITVKSAIKLQSFIRGYLVRKKVLRYITLAIYYQSFCDKLQDVLSSHVKKNVFNKLKQIKKLKIKKSSTNMTNIISNNNSKSFISSIGYQSPETYQSPLTFINISNNNSNNKYQNYSQYTNNNYTKRSILRKKYLKNENNLRFKTWKNNNSNNINNSKNKNNNVVENCETVKTTTRIITNNVRKISRKKSKNEIMSGGTLSIIKLPNRRLSNSGSEKIFTQIKEHKKKVYIRNDYKEEQKRNSDSNTIFEKIIIREIKKPETAEDGNDRQLFNMEISKNVNMKIQPAFEKRLVTKKEIKEMEIIKKREIERNKEVTKYKQNYEKIKNKNKLDNLKHVIKIVEYHKKSIFKKIFEKFRDKIKKIKNKDTTYEIQTANNIQIKQKSKEKKDFSVQKITEKKEILIQTNKEENKKNKFDKLLITENRSVSYNGKQKDIDKNKKENIIITNDKLNILSNIKKEEFGIQIGSWDTKIENIKNNDINIIKIKPELTDTGVQYKPEENKITHSNMDIIISNISKEDNIKEGKQWNPVISKINNDINIINIKTKKIEEGSQSINIENKIDKNEQIKIIQNRPELIDTEIQHEYPDNQITKSKLDIISKIPKNDDSCQIEGIKIYKNNNEISKIKNEIIIIPKKPEKVDECTQYVKIENIIGKTKEYKILQKKKDLVETGIQQEKIENKITKSKFDIISPISLSHKDKIWIKPWNPQISKNNSCINILQSKTKQQVVETGIQYTPKKNSVSKISDINIIHNKPKLIDSEIQHEPTSNIVDKNQLQIEIRSAKKKPKYVDSITQCENENTSFIDEGINTTNEEPKKIEIKIRTIKRSIHDLEIPLLKKIWLRKAFRTFKTNCQRPSYHYIIKKEFLRMYLLKWRFIKGYGPDRYGNIYDRNGNLLYKTQGKVVDEQIQQDFIIAKDEQSTQCTPIENVISKLKQMEIKSVYNRKKEPEKNDVAIGNDLIIGESIQRNNEFSFKINKTEKQINNQIDNNYNLEIKKKEKILRDQTTSIDNPLAENKIIQLEKINISNEDYLLKKKIFSRKKTLLTQMLYKKIINEKLILCDYLRQWSKQSLLISNKSRKAELENQKRNNIKISKNDKFSLIEEIQKSEIGTQISKEENQIEGVEKLKIINSKQKIDSETSVDILPKFEKINPQNQSSIFYNRVKNIPLLKIKKENDVNIYSENLLYSEELKQVTKKRINEILSNLINSKETNKSNIKKYFTIWRRNANYLTLMENAQIISEFCKNNFDRTRNYRKWKKICEKLIIKERIKIIKKTKIEYTRKNKIMDLIRITRINSIYAKRRYLHFILLSWLALTRNLSKKKQHIKVLYENMLNTYMNMADDIFGNDNTKNPSVQKALYEVMSTDKYSTKENKDVPKAESYYKSRKESPKLTTNVTYINTSTTHIHKNTIPIRIRTNKYLEKKVIKIGENERLHSKGRGRKYRTKEEKEILHKYNYSFNKELEKDDQDEKEEKENLSMNNDDNIHRNIKLNYSGIKYYTENKNRYYLNQNNDENNFLHYSDIKYKEKGNNKNKDETNGNNNKPSSFFI